MFPAELKKELVLSFRFRRIGSSWKCVQGQPEIVRLTNHDCSQEFSDPVLIWSPSRMTVDARIHDETGIDITNAGSFLGDWLGAKVRCEESLAITPAANGCSGVSP